MAISLAHKSVTVDVNNRNAPNIVAIANVNDKAVRYLDVTLTANGNKLTFTGCTATATFATDGVLIDDAVVCTLNSTADLITVPLENFKSLSGFLAIEIKITNGETQVLNTPLTLKVQVTPSLADNSKINKDSVGTTVEICREVATARGDYDNLGQRLDELIPDEQGFITTFNLANGAVTTPIIADGAVDASKLSQALIVFINNISNKADKATTLDGYGITDAYTKEKADRLLKNKLDSMPFDTVPKLNSPCYLTSGTVYNALADKYDSSNIEYGTATLTPYSTQTDKVKTASCEYKKIGNTVIANVHLVMNECAVGSNAVLHLLNMPFKGARITRCLGVSSANNYVCKGQITTAAWFQLVNTSKTTMSFSADEEVDFTVNYKILGA